MVIFIPMNEVASGNIKIRAIKARDNHGRKGYFISNEDWATFKNIVASKGAKVTTKKSLLPGMKDAFNEIRADLLGLKPLPNSSEPITEL